MSAPHFLFLVASTRAPGTVGNTEWLARQAAQSLRLVTTSGDRAKAQPMIDSIKLCGDFLTMRWGGALWAQGGAPGMVAVDAAALAEAQAFLR